MGQDALDRRTVLAAMAAVAAGGGAGAAAAPAAGVPGWSEAVAIVSNGPRVEAWLAEVAGWRAVWRGATPPAVLRAWGLAEGARGAETLLGNPGDGFGRVRLVELAGVGPQRRIRPAAMPWDTGGLFSLMARTRDLKAALERHFALGFDAYSEPYDFDFGGVALRNIVLRGPDGINLALYQRLRPELVGWTTITRLSAPFNAMMMVRDVAAARDFWTREAGLGLGVLSEGQSIDSAPDGNNFAVPTRFSSQIARRYAIMAEPGAETGRVEALGFEGLGGRDFSAFAAPPNLGLALLRFRRPRGTGGPAAPLADIAPYGRVALSQLRSPDGVIAELLAG